LLVVSAIVKGYRPVKGRSARKEIEITRENDLADGNVYAREHVTLLTLSSVDGCSNGRLHFSRGRQ